MIVRSKRRPLVWACLLMGALVLAAPHGGSRAYAASDRPVMAFYYPWYEMSDWSYDKMSDVAAPKYRGGDETNPTNGRPYLTQHFERARFEYHPENAGTPYAVLLGLLGRELTGIK